MPESPRFTADVRPAERATAEVRLSRLLHNLAHVLTDVFRAHAAQLARINARGIAVPTPLHDPTDPSTGPSPSSVPLAPPQPARRVQRVAAYEQVWTSHRQGWRLEAIEHQVGLSRRTVQRDSPESDVSRAPTTAWP